MGELKQLSLYPEPVNIGMKQWFKCAYDDCKSNLITVTEYRGNITYECYCRECKRKWVKSINTEV